MRRAAKVDANQTAIVRVLRKIGCSVQPLHAVGKGCPDLLVGRTFADGSKRNYLLEVKDGAKPPSARELTADQQAWLDKWQGPAVVVSSESEALAAVGFDGRRSAEV